MRRKEWLFRKWSKKLDWETHGNIQIEAAEWKSYSEKKQLDVFSLVSGRNRLAKRRSVRMDSEAYGAGQPPNMLA
jgi:hypothetical protein